MVKLDIRQRRNMTGRCYYVSRCKRATMGKVGRSRRDAIPAGCASYAGDGGRCARRSAANSRARRIFVNGTLAAMKSKQATGRREGGRYVLDYSARPVAPLFARAINAHYSRALKGSTN